MSDIQHCPQCSAPLPADAPAGLCPACLMKQGFNSVDATVSMPRPTDTAKPVWSPDPMSIEELAPYFPQLEIIELLGRGGMGIVYKARQRQLDRLVALKILPTDVIAAPAFSERFTREAKALAHLSHPHIVAIYDFGRAYRTGSDPHSPTAPALYYLLMEFVDGSNLRGIIKSLSADQALAIVPQICEALQFAHEEGIVHRDIKPENILVDKKGRVKIADFGLAKLLEHAAGPADYTLTHPDRVLGTLHYMAPEQFERPTEVDHRADIYSLGVVFYELLTGHLPLGRFALPSETKTVDARLDEVVLKALEREPDKRYQHASEVKTSVDSVRNTPAAQPAAPASPAAAPVSIPVPPVAIAPASHETADAQAKPEKPQRLSRNAIAGAICGIAASLAGLAACIAQSNIQTRYYFDSQAGLYHKGPDWAIALWCIGLALAAIGAVVMPLLGAIGVAQIRRTPEKLYGLRLALFDALLVPLLLLDSVALGFLFAVYAFNTRQTKAGLEVPESSVFGELILPVLMLVLVLLADAWAYWWFWKKLRVTNGGTARKPEIPRHAPASASPPTAHSQPTQQLDLPSVRQSVPRFSRMTVIAATCGILGIFASPLMIVAASNIHRVYNHPESRYEWEPNWAIEEFCAGAVIAGLAAAAMTLLGAIAVSRIRRSPEKLYGLRLALFDALLFPLLLVNCLVLIMSGYKPIFLLLDLMWVPAFDILVYWGLWKKLRVPISAK